MDLFSEQTIALRLTSERTTDLVLWPTWLTREQADEVLQTAITETPWRADTINIVGKKIPIPRLQNWFGEPGTSYTYSRICMPAVAFPPWMETLRLSVERQTSERFNRALVNYYRSGRDSVDWHADDEVSLGFEPVIASLSLGVERVFQLRHNHTKERVALTLPHGSLLLMGAGTQSYWQHRIAKVKQLDEPRVNFTFRLMDG